MSLSTQFFPHKSAVEVPNTLQNAAHAVMNILPSVSESSQIKHIIWPGSQPSGGHSWAQPYLQTIQKAFAEVSLTIFFHTLLLQWKPNKSTQSSSREDIIMRMCESSCLVSHVGETMRFSQLQGDAKHIMTGCINHSCTVWQWSLRLWKGNLRPEDCGSSICPQIVSAFCISVQSMHRRPVVIPVKLLAVSVMSASQQHKTFTHRETVSHFTVIQWHVLPSCWVYPPSIWHQWQTVTCWVFKKKNKKKHMVLHSILGNANCWCKTSII